ncbi:ferredoxin [Polychaeton citri CBS 116435]|uniref:Ferredoxin n=1 Tax=Polychaeton citri CBS 116435 TaxID=1314669 RepID=A0A9P4Q9Z5_9PEZI|nr:ferredoxin [Polychaeton citri CBS 116435]
MMSSRYSAAIFFGRAQCASQQCLRQSFDRQTSRAFSAGTRASLQSQRNCTLQSRSTPQWQRRAFSSSPTRRHEELIPPRPGEERKVTFIDKEGQRHTFEVGDGNNLLNIAQAHDLEMEGACGGSCACSTCHVIVEDEGLFDKMEEPSDDENDMLDLAFGLTETSRLGCQVEMSKELDGLVVKLPSMTRNMQASDFGEKK